MSTTQVSLRAALTTMPAQEVFDIVTKHLLTQKVQARTMRRNVPVPEGLKPKPLDPEQFRCVYRTPEGNKCAVGCLISDEEYANDGPMLEYLGGIRSVVSEAYRDLDDEDLPNLVLLSELQSVHDDHPSVDWETELRRVAQWNGLQFNP
jgi:hypothetical protein